MKQEGGQLRAPMGTSQANLGDEGDQGLFKQRGAEGLRGG